MSSNVFIGDLPLSTTMGDNDTFVGCIGGTAKGIKFANLKNEISADISATWSNVSGRPFDTIDSTYLKVNTTTVGVDTVDVLSFSTEVINKLNDIDTNSADISDLKDFTSYATGASSNANSQLHRMLTDVMSAIGFSEQYNSQTEEYHALPASTVNPTVILNLVNAAMFEIGYTVTFDTTQQAWKYVRDNSTPVCMTNVFNAIFNNILGYIGYTFTVENGTTIIAPNSSPYRNSDLQSWSFNIMGNLWGNTATYDGQTGQWSFSPDYSNFRDKAYIKELRRTIFDNEWTADQYYDAGSVVVYNGAVYQCLTDNNDSVFTPANWQRLTPTYSEYTVLEARVSALENNS